MRYNVTCVYTDEHGGVFLARLITIALVVLLIAVSLPALAQSPSWGVVAKGDWGVLWTQTPLVKVMKDTPPPAKTVTMARIHAAKNEYEAFQLVLTPKKAVANVRIVPHTLTGPKGAKIGSWDVTVKNVEYVNCTTPTSKDVTPGWYPDPLPDHTPFNASTGQNSSVWITVYASPKTPAGDYKGTVDVVAAGMGKVSVPLSVHVWDFALPSVSRLRTAYGNAPWSPAQYQAPGTLEQRRKLQDLYNLDFFKHRVSPYRPYNDYDIGIKTAGDTVTLDFTEFDKAIQKWFPMFNSFMLPRFAMSDDVGFGKGPDGERMKIDYMRQVAEHLTEKGQIAKGYDYITDEPSPEQYDEIVQAAKNVRLADQRIKILLTKKVEDKLIGSVDIWVPILAEYDEQRSKDRQAKGEQVWWYSCTWPKHPYPAYFIDYPAMDLRMFHWMTWHYGLNGILYWETMYWKDNPWESPMSRADNGDHNWGNGDGHLLYPPVRTPSKTFVEKGPVDSIRWETIRDGIEDWDYFRILQDKIDAASDARKASPAYASAQDAMKQVNECIKSEKDYCGDSAQAESVRLKVAIAIEQMK